ncbi:dipeptidase [Pseudobacteriovorax antillogorgiicola]|uniref:Membrane dipeptidase n=1 Tax=Pseudobacteriovorax antillogorgiicola TaxID=1513793 RepID=A0A1Y6CVK9_9BACT|nr:dipeptidase [Pseudobacteriovorax antillogorgiicola]TCS43495.1 membrane dipeptidase [Pseudobacteriovorax antillogorgiicola]SMF81179.1 membrane dipeptidase [Pseudobacteriovorax antillogorgiicola]
MRLTHTVLTLLSLSLTLACTSPRPSTNWVVDGHNDLPWALRSKNVKLEDIDLRETQKDFHTDLKRLKDGNVGLQLWSAYVPASTAEKKTALNTTLEQIDLIHRMVEHYPESLAMVGTSQEAEQAIAEGKIASMIGVEGGYSIEGSLAHLRTLYRLGVRYMTLTHSKTIFWADSATDVAQHHGLTDFGKSVIEEMNRLGMLVDISHVSVATMKDALAVTKAPVIASHSSAYALAEHPRNIPDDVLKQIASNRGIVMINFFSGYIVPEAAAVLRKYEVERFKLRMKHQDDKAYQAAIKQFFKENPMKPGTVKDVADHVDHIVKIAGVEYVGLGSDFDGVGTLPKDLDDVSKFPNLDKELERRGYSREDREKIFHSNFLRVLREAEQVASQMKVESTKPQVAANPS